ncbi:hypothetical protein VP01_2628g1 [Puccinia sorghi]|uniref:Uncharacterized protein n=1 Tax=Puccinia sorghi TaxID=27349 RepID=A0A0L6V513_9BASI|nr:hypothetical protein VP01_2628g1 [Puccinia sorghi]
MSSLTIQVCYNLCLGALRNQLGNTFLRKLKKNKNPDRRLKANINKISTTIQQQMIPTRKKTLKDRISDLPIGFSALINQLASHHSPLHHPLFKAKRRLDPCCPHCPGREISTHLLNFLAYKAARQQHSKAASKERIKFPWNNPHALLKNPKAYQCLSSFLKQSG